MVTQATEELPQDHRTMRTLVRETKHTAGVYARVVAAGEVRAGDEVEFAS
jgi:MOSC domain-containing protein YiiM